MGRVARSFLRRAGPLCSSGAARSSDAIMKAKHESDADHTHTGASTRAEVNSTIRVGASAPRSSTVVPVQRFEDRGEIARGGMSSVRRVFDRLVLREVAMKVLEPTRDFDDLARFVEEAQITGQL